MKTNIWKDMCTLCGRQAISTNCNNGACDDDYVDNGHCRDKNDTAIPPIEDCEEHFRICTYDCHDECACQDFER